MSGIGGERAVPAPTPSDSPALDAARHALDTVYDPELGLSVVSLGLVYDLREEGDVLVVEMTLTTPGCPASESLPAIARDAVARAVPGAVVDVRVVWDPPWTPARMSDLAAAALGFRRRG